MTHADKVDFCKHAQMLSFFLFLLSHKKPEQIGNTGIACKNERGRCGRQKWNIAPVEGFKSIGTGSIGRSSVTTSNGRDTLKIGLVRSLPRQEMEKIASFTCTMAPIVNFRSAKWSELFCAESAFLQSILAFPFRRL